MLTLPGHSSTQPSQKLYLAGTIPDTYLEAETETTGVV